MNCKRGRTSLSSHSAPSALKTTRPMHHYYRCTGNSENQNPLELPIVLIWAICLTVMSLPRNGSIIPKERIQRSFHKLYTEMSPRRHLPANRCFHPAQTVDTLRSARNKVGVVQVGSCPGLSAPRPVHPAGSWGGGEGLAVGAAAQRGDPVGMRPHLVIHRGAMAPTPAGSGCLVSFFGVGMLVLHRHFVAWLTG